MVTRTKNIRLSRTDSLRSTDKEKSLDVGIKSTFRKLRDTELVGKIDLNKLFEMERDACTKYRLVLTINPFCSNVLFNTCTEVVINEGDYSQRPVTDIFDDAVPVYEAYGKQTNVTRNDMVCNTEYSREGMMDSNHKPVTYEYHPGLDIFNNHILRNRTGKVVRFMDHQYDNFPQIRNVFNTLKDYERYSNGNIVKFCPRMDITNSAPQEIERHLYTVDDVYAYYNNESYVFESIEANLKTDNGWFGFNNTTTVDTKNPITNEKLDVNRVINNKGNCEYVDMYPDRSLFSFTPKYNNYKKRLEYNWDIEITYPYRNFYKHPLVRGGSNNKLEDWVSSGDLSVNGMYILYGKYGNLSYGSKGLMFRTCVKHGLKDSDNINLYYTDIQGNYDKVSNPCVVSSLGDENNKYGEYFFKLHGTGVADEIAGKYLFDDNLGIYEENTNPQNPSEYTLYSGVYSMIPILNERNTEDPQDDSMYRHIRFYEYVEYQGPESDDLFNALNTFIRIPENTLISPQRIMVYDGINEPKYYEKEEKYYDLRTVGNDSDSDEMLMDDVIEWFDYILSEVCELRYAKVVDDIQSEYYFRIFRKLPNLKFATDPINDDKVDNGEVFEQYVAENATTDGIMDKFDSEWYNLAFANTIYGDKITQLTYTDSLDIKCLKDNLGRPLTSVYATIVKKNCGYEKWYSPAPQYDNVDFFGGDDVEYSHCFGKVTSGVECLVYDDDDDVVREKKKILSDVTLITNINDSSKELEKYIFKNDSIDGIRDDEFFGDVVEFNPTEYTEKVLGDVNFRFNTAQREAYEIANTGAYWMHVNEITADDYDLSGFVVTGDEGVDSYKNAIIRPEGYYYKAHYEMPVREFGEKRQDSHYRLNVDTITSSLIESGQYLTIKTVSKHKSSYGDIVYFCDDESGEWYETRIVYIVDDKTFTCTVPSIVNNLSNGYTLTDFIDMVEDEELLLRRRNAIIPEYSVRVRKNDFVWRDINGVGNVANRNLKEYPFTNGTFYIDKPIDFYLKRQDPEGVNGLFVYGAINGIPNNPEGNVIKERNNDFVEEGLIGC